LAKGFYRDARSTYTSKHYDMRALYREAEETELRPHFEWFDSARLRAKSPTNVCEMHVNSIICSSADCPSIEVALAESGSERATVNWPASEFAADSFYRQVSRDLFPALNGSLG